VTSAGAFARIVGVEKVEVVVAHHGEHEELKAGP
jgi:hypothetical protein